MYTVEVDEAARRASVVTGLLVFRTTLDGGATSLFAVCKLHDVIRLEDGGALLASRRVRLDTRDLGIGTHILL